MGDNPGVSRNSPRTRRISGSSSDGIEQRGDKGSMTPERTDGHARPQSKPGSLRIAAPCDCTVSLYVPFEVTLQPTPSVRWRTPLLDQRCSAFRGAHGPVGQSRRTPSNHQHEREHRREPMQHDIPRVSLTAMGASWTTVTAAAAAQTKISLDVAPRSARSWAHRARSFRATRITTGRHRITVPSGAPSAAAVQHGRQQT